MIVLNTAARGPASTFPRNNQFFRLCGDPHNRNYAGLRIMRSWAGAPSQRRVTFLPPAGFQRTWLRIIRMLFPGSRSFSREDSHARCALPTAPSPPPIPGQPPWSNPRPTRQLPDQTRSCDQCHPSVPARRRALRLLAGDPLSGRVAGPRHQGLGPAIRPRPPGCLCVPTSIPPEPHPEPCRGQSPAADARSTGPGSIALTTGAARRAAGRVRHVPLPDLRAVREYADLPSAERLAVPGPALRRQRAGA